MSRVLDLWAGMTGTVLDFAGTAAPTGWLLCYGQSLLRTDYPNLFTAIGTAFGSVDGTHFTMPDCRGRVGAGKDNMGGSAAARLNISTTGNTTNASAVVTSIPNALILAAGMNVFGTGIPANATILTIDSNSQITLTAAATATASGVALRFGIVDGATLGAVGGVHLHTMTSQEMPAHTHNYLDYGGTATAGSGYDLAANAGSNYTVIATSGAGVSMPHPNVQPTMVLNKIIKT